MFVIEVCSHLARILSLTIRLFANMFASDMVTLVFFTLFPIGIPIIFMLLHAGVASSRRTFLSCWRPSTLAKRWRTSTRSCNWHLAVSTWQTDIGRQLESQARDGDSRSQLLNANCQTQRLSA